MKDDRLLIGLALAFIVYVSALSIRPDAPLPVDNATLDVPTRCDFLPDDAIDGSLIWKTRHQRVTLTWTEILPAKPEAQFFFIRCFEARGGEYNTFVECSPDGQVIYWVMPVPGKGRYEQVLPYPLRVSSEKPFVCRVKGEETEVLVSVDAYYSP